MRRCWKCWAVSCGLAVGLTGIGYTQNAVALDYMAHLGSCEVDFNRDGRVDSVSFVLEGVADTDFVCSLDHTTRYAGTASQRIRLQRNAPQAGALRVTFWSHTSSNMPLRPNEAVRLRIAYRAQGFSNATYEIFASTEGLRTTMVAPTAQSTNGWQVAEVTLPARPDSSGAARVYINVRIAAQAGAAIGEIWLDEVRALSAGTMAHPTPLPNGLKLAISYLDKESDWLRVLHNYRWQLVVGAREHRLSGFRQTYPGTLYAAYAYFTGPVIHAWARHNDDIYNFDDVWNNRRHWLLRDRNNNLIFYDDTYYIDLGIPEVRQRAQESLLDLIPRVGFPQYIFLDNLDVHVGPQRYAPPNYPTNDLWVQQVVSWFQQVGSAIRNAYGTRFLVNVAWSPGFFLRGVNGGQDAPGAAVIDYVGGFWIEHAFCFGYNATATNQPRNYTLPYGSVHEVNNWRAWTLRNEIRIATEYPDKIVVINPSFDWEQPNFRQKLRFSIALTLAIQHANTYISLDPRHPRRIHPEGYIPPELLIPLGNPVGPMQFVQGNLLEGGLIVRQYQYGVVVVNPMHDRTYTYTVPIRGYNWDRQIVDAGTQIQLPPHTGMVFYAAPEMRIAIRASRQSVRPGEEVSYKVEYFNDGLAAAQNVQIRVPLPEGMQLIGSVPAATVEGRELVWTIPNVAAGERGVLSFRVRVQ